MQEWHITDDPERAAGYVLGRISAEERERLEEHLVTCPACRAAVDAERLVAAAARRLGRDTLKARLRDRAGRSQRAGRILAVAATIAVLVGIGLVTRQLLVTPEGQETSQMLSGRPVPSPAEPSLRTAPQHEAPAVTGTVPEDRRARADARGATAGSGAGERLTADSPVRRDNEVLSTTTAEAPSPAKDLARAKQAAAAPVEAETAGKVTLERMSPEESYWTEGLATAAAVREERSLDESKEKKETPVGHDLKGDAAVRPAGAKDAAPRQQYILNQRPAAELPASRQNLQMYRNSVPTLVRQRGTQTEMTLYLDSLLDPSELARARIEQRGQDSLVIRMQNQNIQYQLPANRTPVR